MDLFGSFAKVGLGDIPIGSMYGIFTYICHILPLKTTIHVGKYTSPMDGMGDIKYTPFFATYISGPRDLQVIGIPLDFYLLFPTSTVY